MKRMTFVLAMFGMAGSLVAADPILGTWKLNVAKSKFKPGPAPKSVTATYSEDGDWMVMKTEGVDAEGQPIARTNRVKRDGNEYPFDGPYGSGKIAIKQKDDHHSEAVMKLDGGGIITTRSVISKDGKTRTQTSTGTNSKGEKVDSVAVFDRQ